MNDSTCGKEGSKGVNFVQTARNGTALMVMCMALFGCSSLYQVDLPAARQQNLAADRAILHQNDIVIEDSFLSQDEAVQIGLANNLERRISQALIDIADDVARSEKLRLLPSLTVNGNIAYRDELPQREFIDSTTGETQLSNSVSQERFQRTASANLTWNLLDFGLSYFRSRQAAHQSEIRRLEQERQAQTLALDIVMAYRQAALAEDNLAYIAEMAEMTQRFKESADALVEERRLDPIVARQIERDLTSLAVTAGDLQAEMSGARITLCRLMGISPMSDFKMSTDEFLYSRLESLPDLKQLDPEALEALALLNRPELYSEDLQELIQQDEARAALVSMFPGIRLNGGYMYDGDDFLVDSTWTTVGADLVYDLLSLPSGWYDYRAKKKGVEHARLERLLLTASIIAQVHLSLHDYGVRKKQFELYSASYDIRTDLLDMTRERNAAGTAGFPDTLVTERMMETVVGRIQRGRQLASLLNAYDTLAVTIGMRYPQWDEITFSSDDTSPSEEFPEDPAENSLIDTLGRGEKNDEAIGNDLGGGYSYLIP
jgi:outer membrane protein, multidrug efflux system